MTDAREIIAEVIQDFRDAGQPINDVVLSVSDDIISTLTAAGYRILGPDEVDPVTVEKAAALCLSASVEATNPSRACQADELGEAVRALGRKA